MKKINFFSTTNLVKKEIFALIALSILLIGCAQTTEVSEDLPKINEEQKQNQPDPGEPTIEPYTLEEVAKHNSAEDCWTVVNGIIYDITDYIPNHKPSILQGCGLESTKLFEEKHSEKPNARIKLEEYKIGEING